MPFSAATLRSRIRLSPRWPGRSREDFVWSLSLSNLLALQLWGELDTVHQWLPSGYWSASGARRTLELATMAGVLLVALFFFAVLRAERLLPARAAPVALRWTRAAALVVLALRLSLPDSISAVLGLGATGWASHIVRSALERIGPVGMFLPGCLVAGILST